MQKHHRLYDFASAAVAAAVAAATTSAATAAVVAVISIRTMVSFESLIIDTGHFYKNPLIVILNNMFTSYCQTMCRLVVEVTSPF